MRKILTFIILIALLILSASKAQINYDIFIKINVKPNIESFLISTPFIKTVLRMKSYYIVLACKKELEKYIDQPIEYHILSTYKPNYSYFLLKYHSIDSLSKIKTQGDIIILEDGVSFFVYKTIDQPPKLPRDILSIAIPLSHEKIPTLKAYPKITAKYTYIPTKEIIDMLSKVSLKDYKNNIQALQNFKTRYYDTEGGKKAAEFIYKYFKNLGLQTESQSFSIYNVKTQNIIATQHGVSDPSSIVIIGAHYDSYSYDINNAPGADDNASGTAAVMEAARILKNYQFDFTIKYITFGAEEIGLYGSAYYASNASQQNEKIIAVINLDMISYVDLIPEDINIASNEKSAWLGEMFKSLTETYTNVKAVNTIDPSFRWSDHSSFWHSNYSAILAIEDLNISNPFYHSPADTIDTLTLNFGIETTKAAISSIVTLAQLYDPQLPMPPKDISIKPVYSYSLFDSRKHISLSWDPNNSNTLGFNIYKTNISHLHYSKLNASPITEPFYKDIHQPPDSFYFYVITAISPNYQESHFSAEVSED